MLTPDHRLVDGATGCSNQLNASRPVVRRLVLDSLAHWADTMGVDGFRLDLAPVLGRQPDHAERDDWGRQRHFFDDHPLLVDIEQMAAEREVEVVAEAWDLWGYEVGNFPTGWGEWNGRYRDAVRACGTTGRCCPAMPPLPCRSIPTNRSGATTTTSGRLIARKTPTPPS
ncbi:alpha-amylase family glycosyl hydrolase [Luteococcus sp. OSA5]|uniref:alpha-amylase family glycosyl hydrolase n=1 Tax=Luteococcus sp. OSA5 TaxID=3401630 RepID=UPI003B43CF24